MNDDQNWEDHLESAIVTLGGVLSYLSLAMVAVTFSIVVLRYVFHFSRVWLQESVVYMHAILFLGTSSLALAFDQHVRVDLFYRSVSEKGRSWINLIGVVFFLWPVCLMILYVSTSYVISSWRVFETSPDSQGLPFVFLLKSVIWVFCISLALQGVVLFTRSLRKILS